MVWLSHKMWVGCCHYCRTEGKDQRRPPTSTQKSLEGLQSIAKVNPLGSNETGIALATVERLMFLWWMIWQHINYSAYFSVLGVLLSKLAIQQNFFFCLLVNAELFWSLLSMSRPGLCVCLKSKTKKTQANNPQITNLYYEKQENTNVFCIFERVRFDLLGRVINLLCKT